MLTEKPQTLDFYTSGNYDILQISTYENALRTVVSKFIQTLGVLLQITFAKQLTFPTTDFFGGK